MKISWTLTQTSTFLYYLFSLVDSRFTFDIQYMMNWHFIDHSSTVTLKLIFRDEINNFHQRLLLLCLSALFSPIFSNEYICTVSKYVVDRTL